MLGTRGCRVGSGMRARLLVLAGLLALAAGCQPALADRVIGAAYAYHPPYLRYGIDVVFDPSADCAARVPQRLSVALSGPRDPAHPRGRQRIIRSREWQVGRCARGASRKGRMFVGRLSPGTTYRVLFYAIGNGHPSHGRERYFTVLPPRGEARRSYEVKEMCSSGAAARPAAAREALDAPRARPTP